jgi:multidrug efflux pump subunit AcrA (membrane-fusion protein)
MKRMKRWYSILLLLCILALVAAAGFWGFRSSAAQDNLTVEAPTTVAAEICDVQQSVTAPGKLANLHQVNLEMPVDGSLQEILVRPGDHVQEGQALARIGERESFLAGLREAQSQVLEAQIALDELTEQANANRVQAVEDIAAYEEQVKDAQYRLDNFMVPAEMKELSAREAVAQMKQDLDQARAAFEPYKFYSVDNPTRIRLKEDLDVAQAAYNAAVRRLTLEYSLEVAQANLDQALEKLDRWSAGPDGPELELAQANLVKAQENVEQAQADLDSLEIRAPFAGVILEVSADPGETLAAHSTVILINDPQQVEIEATVTEEDYPLLKPGQSTQIYFTARPDVTAQGQVDRIVPKLVEGSSPTYEIFISLDQLPEGLVDGMTVDTNVTIAIRPGVLCLPRSVVHASADNKAILQVWDGVQTEERQVSIGLRGDSNVEILSGLEEGEQVVVR